MALRIGGGKPMPVEEETVEELPMEDEMMEISEDDSMMEEEMDEPTVETVDPEAAGYKGPEQGPFMCGTCEHYQDGGTCAIVSGPIDEGGICSIYESAGMGESEEVGMEEEVLEEEPIEEPIEEEVIEEV